MSLTSHLAELERKHKALEQELHKAAMSPSISDHQIAEIKRRKLALKDEITRLREAKPARGATLH